MRGAGGARTRDQRIMRASHLGRRDLTALYEVCCQTVVFRTGTTEYATETCRALKRVVETTAECADWRTDCLAHLGVPDQPSTCEAEFWLTLICFRWSNR